MPHFILVHVMSDRGYRLFLWVTLFAVVFSFSSAKQTRAQQTPIQQTIISIHGAMQDKAGSELDSSHNAEFLRTPLIRVLDANGDGVISKQEIDGAAQKLSRLDKDGDGDLKAEEWLGELSTLINPPSRPGDPPARRYQRRDEPTFADLFVRRMLKLLDSNYDGKIGKNEAPSRMKNNFDRLDGNHDGVIDQIELRKIASRYVDQDVPPSAPPTKPAKVISQKSRENDENKDGEDETKAKSRD